MTPRRLNRRLLRLIGLVTGDDTPLPDGAEEEAIGPTAVAPPEPAAPAGTAPVPALPAELEDEEGKAGSVFAAVPFGDDFDRLLKEGRVRTLFQPIVSLSDGSVLGYEALSRGPIGTRLETADALFSTAAERGVAAQLERICRFRAIAAASSLPAGCYLFLNISPRVFEGRDEALSGEGGERSRLPQERIVLEITEKQAIADFELFKRALQHYNRQGFKVAIDDAGAGHNSLRAVTEVRPHFIKLDMALVRDIDRDRAKNALVTAIIMFARRIDAKVLAEGIETIDELATLIEIGVEYGQGFLLARPSSVFAEPKPEIAAFIRERASARRLAPAPRRMTIGSAMRRAPALAPTAFTLEVIEIFERNPDLDSIVLVDAGLPVGIISRSKLNERLSHQFGYSIYAKRPARAVMDDSFLAVDANDPIEEVARKVVHRRRADLYDEIVVLEDGAYAGVVSVRDLLHTMTECHNSVSRYSNPLTGLPGRILLTQEVERRCTAHAPFALLHVDINHLRQFNERHGFSRGDDVINLLAETLVNAVRGVDREHGFVAHLGGVNFVALCAEEKTTLVAGEVIADFDRRASSLQPGRDLAGVDHDAARLEPVLTITVVGLRSSHTPIPSFAAAAASVARFKRVARALRSSSFVLDGELLYPGHVLPRRLG